MAYKSHPLEFTVIIIIISLHGTAHQIIIPIILEVSEAVGAKI